MVDNNIGKECSDRGKDKIPGEFYDDQNDRLEKEQLLTLVAIQLVQ